MIKTTLNPIGELILWHTLEHIINDDQETPPDLTAVSLVRSLLGLSENPYGEPKQK